MNFDLALDAAQLALHRIDLGVGGIDLRIEFFLAAFFYRFTGLDQLFEVVGTFLTYPGVSPEARQPDLARVAAHLTQRALGVVFFLQDHFGHTLHLTL
ncbi:hypothetical protein D3C80_1101520 [compost metagenome]